jgi:hypothetical protein
MQRMWDTSIESFLVSLLDRQGMRYGSGVLQFSKQI